MRQQHRAIKPRLVDCLRPELSRKRHTGCVARTLLFDQRNDPRHYGDYEQCSYPEQQGPQPAGPAFCLLTARLDEFALQRVQLIVMLGGPVECASEPRAAVQLAGVATRGFPFARAGHEVRVQTPSGAVLLEPEEVTRPLAQ